MKQTALRFLAVVILLALVSFVWQLLFMPAWSAVILERQQMAQYLERTARQHVIETRATEYAQWLKKYPDNLVSDRVYAAPNVNGAETFMQRDVNAAAQRAGITVNSIEGAAGKKAAGFVQMTLRLNLSGNSDQLAAFLENLHNNERNIAIVKGSVKVRRMEDQRGPADLAINLEVTAYAKV